MSLLGGIRAGRAFVVIDAEDHTGPILRKVRSGMRQFGTDMQALGRELAIAGLLMSAPIISASNVYRDFDDSMRRVQARSSGTADQMAELRNQAMLLGRTTSFTASEIGKMQAALAQKGFNRSQIEGMTEAVLTLARGAGAGIPTDAVNSTNLITGALRAWKMESSDSSKVADIFTAAVNNSNFSLEELIVSMSYASTIASEYGISLEHTTAMLATMRNVNINASTAGTAFRNMLLRLSSEAGRSKFNEELQALTGNTVEMVDASKNLLPIPSILKGINEATAGLGTSQKGSLLGGLFGLRAVVPAATVADMLDNFQEMVGIMEGANGLAKQTEKLMDAGPGGAFRILKSAIEGVQLAIGHALEAPEISLDKILQDLLDTFTRWVNVNKEAVTTYVLVAAGITGLGLSLIALGMSINAISYSAGGLLAIWTLFRTVLIASPWLAAAAAIYSLASALGITSAAAKLVTDTLNTIPGLDKLQANVSEFLATTSSDWKNIVALISAGELELAWELALLAMENKWKSFVAGTEAGISGLQIAMNEIAMGIDVILYETVDSVKDTTDLNMTALRSFMNSAGGFIPTDTAGAQQRYQERKRQRDKERSEYFYNNPDAKNLQSKRNSQEQTKLANQRAYEAERENIQRKIDAARESLRLKEEENKLNSDPQITPKPQKDIESAMSKLPMQEAVKPIIAANNALQRGSVDAAKQSYESRQRDEMAKQMDLETQQLDELKKQTDLLQNLDMGGV